MGEWNMDVNELPKALREEGLQLVAGELTTGELNYMAADVIEKMMEENQSEGG